MKRVSFRLKLMRRRERIRKYISPVTTYRRRGEFGNPFFFPITKFASQVNRLHAAVGLLKDGDIVSSDYISKDWFQNYCKL